jgi:hypothetical protein
MTLFQNLLLFTNHYGNLQEMLEMASFLRYVDLYLRSECGRFYLGHSILCEMYGDIPHAHTHTHTHTANVRYFSFMY